MLEEAADFKKFEKISLGSDLKKQTDFAEKQYLKLEDEDNHKTLNKFMT